MSPVLPCAIVALLLQGNQPEAPREKAMGRAAAAAEDVCLVLQLRAEAGEALTPAFVRLLAEYPRRVALHTMQSEELEEWPEGRTPAAVGLLNRAESLYRTIPNSCFPDEKTERFGVPQWWMAQYYLREAGAVLAWLDPVILAADDVATDPPAHQPALAPLVGPAGDVVHCIVGRAEAGEALTPTYFDFFINASRRECRLRAAAAREPAGRVKAAEVHLEWVKRAVNPGVDIAHRSPEAMGLAYFLSEAELWVALEKASAAGGGDKAAPEHQGKRQELVRHSRQTLAVQQQRMEGSEALTPAFIELLCEWSRRVCRAEMAVAGGNAARRKAADEHSSRMKELHSTLKDRFEKGIDVSRVQVSQARYFVAEAELWLEETTPE